MAVCPRQHTYLLSAPQLLPLLVSLGLSLMRSRPLFPPLSPLTATYLHRTLIEASSAPKDMCCTISLPSKLHAGSILPAATYPMTVIHGVTPCTQQMTVDATRFGLYPIRPVSGEPGACQYDGTSMEHCWSAGRSSMHRHKAEGGRSTRVALLGA